MHKNTLYKTLCADDNTCVVQDVFHSFQMYFLCIYLLCILSLPNKGIAKAVPGGVVLVLPGTYVETKEIFIDKPIHVIGLQNWKTSKFMIKSKDYETLIESEVKPKQKTDLFPIKVSASFLINLPNPNMKVSIVNLELSSPSTASLNIFSGTIFVYNCKIAGIFFLNSPHSFLFFLFFLLFYQHFFYYFFIISRFLIIKLTFN